MANVNVGDQLNGMWYTGSGWTSNRPGTVGNPTAASGVTLANDPWAGLTPGQFNAAGYGTIPAVGNTPGAGTSPDAIYTPPPVDPGYTAPTMPFSPGSFGAFGVTQNLTPTSTPARPASATTNPFPTLAPVSSGTGSMSTTRAADPFSIPGAGAFAPSLVPGMANPTMAPAAATALNNILQDAQSPFITNQFRFGGSTPQQEAQNIMGRMEQWAQLNPDLASTVDWRGMAQRAMQQYLAWVPSQSVAGTQGAMITADMAPVRPGVGTGSVPYSAFNPLTGAGPTTPPQPTTVTGTGGTGTSPTTTPTTTTPTTNPTLDWQAILNAFGARTPSGVTTTPLGYTQYQNGSSPIDAQTMQLLTALFGLMSQGAGRRSNYYQF